jgi:hypothetical protein
VSDDPRDPNNEQEWQGAVNAAEFFLALESARLYGLVEHDFRLDTARCEDILRRGKDRGFVPAPIEDLCRAAFKGGHA